MAMFSRFQPMPLRTRPAPFDDPDWIFELKYDGFRALAVIEHGRARLISRNGNPFASFADLATDIAALADTHVTVLDGEIVCVDKKGRPQFKDLLFRRSDPCFFSFDLLAVNGKDCRMEQLTDRKPMSKIFIKGDRNRSHGSPRSSTILRFLPEDDAGWRALVSVAARLCFLNTGKVAIFGQESAFLGRLPI